MLNPLKTSPATKDGKNKLKKSQEKNEKKTSLNETLTPKEKSKNLHLKTPMI